MRLLLSLLVLASFAVGCGSTDEASDPPETTTSTTTTAVAETTTTATTTEATASTTTTTIRPEDVDYYATDTAALFEFLDTAPDEPFYMVNVIRYRDRAVYEDGRPTSLTGSEADAIYGEFMREEMLPRIGAEVVWVSTVEQDMIGLGDYDTVAVAKYPSPAKFREMTADPEFQEMLAHKRAGVEDTIVLATSLISAPGIPEPTDPPFPPTEDDLPFAFLHLLDYRETAEYQPGDADADPTISGRDAVAKYTANAGIPAVPIGVRPLAWFNVEAVIVGHPGWEEARINWFPSHASFEALTSDPVWQAGSHHRTAGLELTHAFMTSPILINELANE